MMYSDKERKLLNWFDIPDAVIDCSSCAAPTLYRMAVENAYLDQYTYGCETESLRRCAKALRDCSVYRLTPEWDAMIDLDE